MVEYIINPYFLINILYMLTAIIITIIITKNKKR